MALQTKSIPIVGFAFQWRASFDADSSTAAFENLVEAQDQMVKDLNLEPEEHSLPINGVTEVVTNDWIRTTIYANFIYEIKEGN